MRTNVFDSGNIRRTVRDPNIGIPSAFRSGTENASVSIEPDGLVVTSTNERAHSKTVEIGRSMKSGADSFGAMPSVRLFADRLGDFFSSIGRFVSDSLSRGDEICSILIGAFVVLACIFGFGYGINVLKEGAPAFGEMNSPELLHRMATSGTYSGIHEKGFVDLPASSGLGPAFRLFDPLGSDILFGSDELTGTQRGMGFSAFFFALANYRTDKSEISGFVKAVSGIMGKVAHYSFIGAMWALCALGISVIFRIRKESSCSVFLFRIGSYWLGVFLFLAFVLAPFFPACFVNGESFWMALKGAMTFEEISETPTDFVIGVCIGFAVSMAEFVVRYGALCCVSGFVGLFRYEFRDK